MGHGPTAEQQAIIDAAVTGVDMAVEAGAGTGKTTTLRGVAAAKPNDRGYYLAYNSVTAKEAVSRRLFGPNIRPVTIHSLGYQWAKREWGEQALRARLRSQRVPVRESLERLGISRDPLYLGDNRVVQPFSLLRLTMETVKHFCYSTETEPRAWHVPQVNGAEDPKARAEVVARVIPLAWKAWKDLTNPLGKLRFEHDHYLKLWSMTAPVIDADFLMLDEAQDTNPCVAGIIAAQNHLQRIAVGDAMQAIYGWRGATDFLSKMEVQERLYLTQSFRFGQPVADEANKWLTLLDAKLRLRGAPPEVVTSMLGRVDRPDAVLCRSNAEAVNQLMHFHSAGTSVSIVGGGAEMRKLAEAAEQLKTTGQTSNPELAAFTSWGQVQEYVEHDTAGADLKVAVNLIDEHGADAIIDAIDRAVPEGDGEVTVSTAHKSKGREWGRVRIAGDFKEPKPDNEGHQQLPSREEMMLAYVTVTRAQRVLDTGGLAWVDNFLPGSIRVPRVRLRVAV